MKLDLDKKVSEAADAVATWQKNVRAIDARMSAAAVVMSEAEERRKEHALQASLGDHAAIRAIEAARRAHAEAQADVADLQHALEDARRQLNDAMYREQVARNNLARHGAELLMQHRVDKAREIDRVVAELDRLYNDYTALGDDISVVDGAIPRTAFGGVAQGYNDMQTKRRIRAALPKWVITLYPGAAHDEMLAMPLGESEERTWFAGKPRAAS